MAGCVFDVTPIVGSSVARPRLYASLVGLFAVIGALPAAIGLYGVLPFVVHERAAELGVRLALGSNPRVFVATAELFAAAASAAIVVPARRPMRADPSQAIRCE